MLAVSHGFVCISDYRAPHVGGLEERQCCTVDQPAEPCQVTGDTVAPGLAWTELLGDHKAEFRPRNAGHLPPVESDVAGLGVAAVSRKGTADGQLSRAT
jgi:hypothetical protein